MYSQKIIPFLWFEDKAEEAVDFYVSLFSGSKLGKISMYTEATAEVSGQKEGSIMTIDFEIAGQKFAAINGGPYFKFTPAISLFVSCESEEEIKYLYDNLSEHGAVLMEFGKYPFAEKYAWVNDRYGVSWQLILAPRAQKITPMLMFVGNEYGRAKEAMEFYVDIFKHRGEDSEINEINYYDGMGKDGTDKVVHGVFTLARQQFLAMDSGENHKFGFTPAISFVIDCKNQEEVNYFWEKFRLAGKPGQCGWVEDKFGISWQVTPSVLKELMADADGAAAERVTKAMLQMTKLDIETFKKAYANVI